MTQDAHNKLRGEHLVDTGWYIIAVSGLFHWMGFFLADSDIRKGALCIGLAGIAVLVWGLKRMGNDGKINWREWISSVASGRKVVRIGLLIAGFGILDMLGGGLEFLGFPGIISRIAFLVGLLLVGVGVYLLTSEKGYVGVSLFIVPFFYFARLVGWIDSRTISSFGKMGLDAILMLSVVVIPMKCFDLCSSRRWKIVAGSIGFILALTLVEGRGFWGASR